MQRRSLCALLASPVVTALPACGGGSDGGTAGSSTSGGGVSPVAPLKNPLPAINFSPYLAGQNPDRDPNVSSAQIDARLAYVAPLTRRIRTYGSVAGMELAPALAKARGLQVSAGAWLNAEVTNNERQLANLMAIGQAGNADVLVVGNEVLFRNELSASALAGYVRRVKTALPGLRVSCAEVPSRWVASPALVDAVDVLMVNTYPYWQGVAVDNAIAALESSLQAVRAVAGGKPVVLSETGWPSAGNTVSAAVPTEANAARYLSDVIAWAARTGLTDWYWFAAFDEDWKALAEGPQGAHWGLMTSDGAVKPQVKSTLGIS